MKNHQGITFFVLSLLFLLALYCSLLYGGSGHLHFGDINSEFIFYQIRLPKTLTAILAGISLPVAGLLLQVLFRNPLAGPYALGISSGASLFVAVCLLAVQGAGLSLGFLFGRSLLVIAAIAGSLLVTLLLLMISKKVSSNVLLLLVGLMIAQICGALLSALEYFADPNNLKTFVIWGMGSLSGTVLTDLLIFFPLVLLTLLALLFYLKPLNALLLGDQYAGNLGFNIRSIRFALILISSLLTGLTTAFCGPIAFVGISVPILSRILFKTSKQEVQLLACLLLGSTLLLFADALTHHLVTGASLPVNIITTVIGAPIILYLIFKNKQW